MLFDKHYRTTTNGPKARRIQFIARNFIPVGD